MNCEFCEKPQYCAKWLEFFITHHEADYWAQSDDCILHSTQSQAHCIAVKVAGWLVVYFSAICIYKVILFSCSH
jgi:hypothetical protein